MRCGCGCADIKEENERLLYPECDFRTCFNMRKAGMKRIFEIKAESRHCQFAKLHKKPNASIALPR